jgi:tRNA A37 threonylcarbamoyladenosine dehydratase
MHLQVSLLAACVQKGLKVLSATGAGARADPTRIRVADLKESSNDPLSRSVSFVIAFPSFFIILEGELCSVIYH